MAVRGAARPSELLPRAAVFALLCVTIFGISAPGFERDVGLPAIDMEGAAPPARTLELVARYGSEGRKQYLVFLSLDCLLPVAGSLLLLSLFETATRRRALTAAQRRGLALAGALPAICDLSENTLYALLASLYPRHAQPLAALAYVATLAKLASIVVASAVLAVLAVAWLRSRRAGG